MDAYRVSYRPGTAKYDFMHESTTKALIDAHVGRLDWAGKSLKWGEDASDKDENDGDVIITDRLFRIIACGKKTNSVEVVTIYNAWMKDKPDQRSPVYAVHYAGLASTNFDDFKAVYKYSFVHDEYAKHAVSDTHLPPAKLGTPAASARRPVVITMDDELDEICYNVFLFFDRAGTQYYPPNIADAKALNLRPQKDGHSYAKVTIPVPCFPVGDDATECSAKIILHGDFGVDVGDMPDRLKSAWKRATPSQISLRKAVEDFPFAVVSDRKFRTSDGIKSSWRDEETLEAGWKDNLKALCGDDLVLPNFQTYQQLREFAGQKESEDSTKP